MVSDPLSRRDALAVGYGIVKLARGDWVLRDIPARPRTLHEKVARLFVVSFAGTETPDSSFATLIRRFPVGGVILYGRNCLNAGQVKRLNSRIRQLSRFPLIISVDQEGGLVERVRTGVHVFPAEAWYGARGSTSRVYADATTTARDLRSLGFTLNFAPVIDVISTSKSPIGTRSYGSDPALVSRLSVAAVRGYQDHGLASTAKHFVGLGHTSIDSHHALPTVNRTLSELEAVDFLPFRAAIGAGVDSLLVAHVALPAIDPSGQPASLSSRVIRGVVRKQLGFRGAIITDSLVMGALPVGGTDEAAERALFAGADVLLLGSDRTIPAGVLEACVGRIVAAVLAGRIPEHRIDQALLRAARLRAV